MASQAHAARDRQYNLGSGGYANRLKTQGGRCAGCGKLPGPSAKRLQVDHDHACCKGSGSCGKCVRGLLCHDCNQTLAVFKDDWQKLQGLTDYIRHWKEEH